MIISLWNGQRLVGKELAWELQKIRIRNGQKIWAANKYYRRLGHALAEVGERQVRLTEGNSLADAISAYTRVVDELQQFIDDAFESVTPSDGELERHAPGEPKQASLIPRLGQQL